MWEWEDLLEKAEYAPVYGALRAGISLLEKYYCRADDTDIYYIAHGMWHKYFFQLSNDVLISFGSCFQTWVSHGGLGTEIFGSWDEKV